MQNSDHINYRNSQQVILAISKAFTKRSLPANPSILPSTTHTEYKYIEDVQEVDWSRARPSDFERCSTALPLLSSKGFPIVLGAFLRVCIERPVEMLGNEFTLQIFIELFLRTEDFVDYSGYGRYLDLKTEEIDAICLWSKWLEDSPFCRSVQSLSEKAHRLRQNMNHLRLVL